MEGQKELMKVNSDRLKMEKLGKFASDLKELAAQVL